MKQQIPFLKLVLFSLLTAGLSARLEAAISVGPSGSGTITFGTLPAVEDWSTLVNGGGAADIADAAALDAAVQTNVAAAINTVLGSTATTTPAISSANRARWNSALQAVQTVATSAAYISLLATLRNDTGEDQSALTFSYDLRENHAPGGPNAVVEEVPGHRVYFSLTGLAGSWQVIPEISSVGTSGTLVATANLGAWGNGSLLYLLWADDDAQANRDNTNNEEGGYLIDNVTFKAGTITGVIPVGPSGSGTITFSSYPNALEGWATLANAGASADLADDTALDTAVQTNVASAINFQLGSSATVSPSISSSGMARWNTTLGAVETVATGVGYLSLLAKLRNDSGSDQSSLTMAYDLDELNAPGTTVVEEIPGHRVYYSLSGEAGSWVVIPELSSRGTPGTLVATLQLGFWPAGGLLYILWADDNAAADRNNANNEEGGYTIDNVSFSFGAINGISIASPSEGQTSPQGVPIPISAVAVLGGTVTEVAFFDNGTPIGSDTAAPFSLVLSNAALGGHVLTASASDDLGNNASSTPVNITVVPNHPPSVTVTNPADGASFLVGANVAHQVAVSDTDGSVTRVEFLVDGAPFFTDNTSPYSFELCDLTVGPHVISAVAVDNGGFRGTNTISITATNPPGISVIIPNGSAWRYLDDGSDPGPFWTSPGFEGVGWGTGVAELGYGDAGNNRPERTVLGFGPDANAKFPTTYFLKTFTVADPSAFGNLILRLLRDDGAIVYLNGTEVFRSGITNETVDFLTYTPPAAADDGTVYQVTNASPLLLVAGENVVAVEVHQDAANSSDISFDLMLWGEVPSGPVLRITYQPGDGMVSVTWSGGGILESRDELGSGDWQPVLGATSPYRTAATAHRFYRVRVP